MATYQTEIQSGSEGGWEPGDDVSLASMNRSAIAPGNGGIPATGTTVNWNSPQGEANVTFFDSGTRFEGTTQFPNEGPVGYRGTLKT
ncbi:hypothetical protein OG948_38545 (plasmid) [Embleya sp. NBC_00888]|uniref:hypothetical protein n=1 Tax=Embleya sp. NBC_00888 TaxID=2975960 RepID=UPI002F912ED1|nr:hypothetical protein OG948_38545 [Embleya sp. NBC_00888]